MYNDMEHFYPLLFEPNLHETVWGGDRLTTWKALPVHASPVGESWEVSAVPSSIGIVANGPYKGTDLVSLINRSPEAILGGQVSRQYKGKMPLLVKLIDAQRDLSIQVHPNDEMAQRVHGKFGKSEMWYIISADPGAYLYVGFNRKIDETEYKQRIADGTITDVLARHKVHPGDVFYIPAGRVHAIGAGILLAEVQQSSDLTYRIYDYNRPGMDGKPRELHTDLAAEALDYHVESDYRTHYSPTDEGAVSMLSTPYFTIDLVETSVPFHRNLTQHDSFVVAMCLAGDCKIRVRTTGDEVLLHEGFSCMIPAVAADYDLIPVTGHTKVLDAYIANKP